MVLTDPFICVSVSECPSSFSLSTALVLIGISLGAHKKHQELICVLDLISSSQLFCPCLMHESLFRFTEGSLRSCMIPSPAGKAVRDWTEGYYNNRDERSGMQKTCVLTSVTSIHLNASLL